MIRTMMFVLIFTLTYPTLTPAAPKACDAFEGLYQRLIRHEGLKLCAYEDIFHNPTIGVGHLLPRPVEDELCWTHGQVLRVFHHDVHDAVHAAQHDVPTWHELTTVQREVLAELAFQLGPGGLRGFKKMLAAVAEEDFDTAADELLASRLHKQTSRRTEELACLLRHW